MYLAFPCATGSIDGVGGGRLGYDPHVRACATLLLNRHKI